MFDKIVTVLILAAMALVTIAGIVTLSTLLWVNVHPVIGAVFGLALIASVIVALLAVEAS